MTRDRFHCLLIFVTALAIYGASAFPNNAFDEQVRTARAWLHGTMEIDAPDSYIEHAEFQGKKYALHPPMSAAVMVPFVALFGDNTNQVWVSVLIGAVDVVLVWMLLGKLKENDDGSIKGH